MVSWAYIGEGEKLFGQAEGSGIGDDPAVAVVFMSHALGVALAFQGFELGLGFGQGFILAGGEADLRVDGLGGHEVALGVAKDLEDGALQVHLLEEFCEDEVGVFLNLGELGVGAVGGDGDLVNAMVQVAQAVAVRVAFALNDGPHLFF